MRKYLVMAALVLIPALASTQSMNDLSIYITGGVSTPFSLGNAWSKYDLSRYYRVDASVTNASLPNYHFIDVMKSGFGVGFGVGYSFDPSLSGIVEVNYNSFTMDKSQILKGLGLTGNEYMDDVTMKLVSISANVKYEFPQPDLFFDPYIIAGVGYTSIAADDISILASASSVLGASFATQDVINSSLGVGIDVRGGESSSVFVEARWNVGHTESLSPFASDNLGFLQLKLGLKGTF